MPTYDYGCAACGHVFEVFEKINEGGTKACSKCGKKRATRRIGAGAGLIFKGSGFYVNDSKGSSTSASTGGDKKKTTRKTTETKPEAKTESKPEKKEKTEKK
jgi:putative FmdB family regulatory protein